MFAPTIGVLWQLASAVRNTLVPFFHLFDTNGLTRPPPNRGSSASPSEHNFVASKVCLNALDQRRADSRTEKDTVSALSITTLFKNAEE